MTISHKGTDGWISEWVKVTFDNGKTIQCDMGKAVLNEAGGKKEVTRSCVGKWAVKIISVIICLFLDEGAKINAIQVKTSDDQYAGCGFSGCKLTLRVFSSKVTCNNFFLEIMDIPFRIVAPMT